jgi:hypothetical protein
VALPLRKVLFFNTGTNYNDYLEHFSTRGLQVVTSGFHIAPWNLALPPSPSRCQPQPAVARRTFPLFTAPGRLSGEQALGRGVETRGVV